MLLIQTHKHTNTQTHKHMHSSVFKQTYSKIFAVYPYLHNVRGLWPTQYYVTAERLFRENAWILSMNDWQM